jgi:hypothetical protein
MAPLAAAALTSCSKGPEPPRPGTPAFYWSAAKTAFHADDFVKTDEHLHQLIRGDNEFTARARPWAIVLSSGMARAYSDLAGYYDDGARANRGNPTPFRKQASALRSLSSASSLEFAEDVHGFLANDKSPNVVLALECPDGSAALPAGLKKVTSGALIQESERDLLLSEMLQRSVLLSVARVVGSPDDTAQTLEKFKAGEVSVTRATFVYAVAKALFEQSDLFGGKMLDQPNRLKMMCQEALEALQSIPETGDTKQLQGKIEAVLKRLKAT